MIALLTNWHQGTIEVRRDGLLVATLQAVPEVTIRDMRAGKLDAGITFAHLDQSALDLQSLLMVLGHGAVDVEELT